MIYYIQLLLNCTTKRDVVGAVIGVLAVSQDITLRKRAGVLCAACFPSLVPDTSLVPHT
jgi:hypothetical protein